MEYHAHTILMDASARLMKLGATSPSWPAASRAEASHSDKIVPTSWAKDSVQDLSLLGRPSAYAFSYSTRVGVTLLTYVSRGR